MHITWVLEALMFKACLLGKTAQPVCFLLWMVKGCGESSKVMREVKIFKLGLSAVV